MKTLKILQPKLLEKDLIKIDSEFPVYNVKNNDYFVLINSFNISTGNYIVDMNGIDNFMFAKELLFMDDLVRLLAKKLFMKSKGIYRRYGVAGTPETETFKGGEVLEYQRINSKNLRGKASSVCGYLTDSNFSKTIALTEDNKSMRELRSVYSHTFWTRKDSKREIINIEATLNDINLLDYIYDYLKENKIGACGIRINARNIQDHKFKIKGRVLKHLPTQQFKDITDASNIAVEKEFFIPKKSRLIIYGTKYKRYEPEWTKLTNGHVYERRGHFHAAIFNKKKGEYHECFHLREFIIQKGGKIRVHIYPVESIYRIYPVEKRNDFYVLKTTGRKIDEVEKTVREYINE